MRTDGLEDLLPVSDAFNEQGIRLQVNTCMEVSIPTFSDYFKPIVIDIEAERHKAEIRELNERLAALR